MTEREESGWRIVSMGVVANNKELGSDVIQVIPIEQAPFIDGELASVPFDAEASGKDSQGNSFNVKTQTDQAIAAKWARQAGANRGTPPDVRRGQRVHLWKFADKNDYWWTYAGLDDHLFKLETVVMRFSATADEAADSTALENCYYLEISSHTKTITLQTAKVNGEFCKYVLQINMAEGRVVLTDDLGNDFTLDSKETVISMENAEGTILALNKKDISMYAPQHIQMVAEQNIEMTCKTYSLDCETGRIDASSGFTLKTPTFTADVQNTTFTGNVSVNQGFTAKQGGTFQGPATFQQPISANGITSTATIRGPSGSI